MRPSGTEPKVKCYFEVVVAPHHGPRERRSAWPRSETALQRGRRYDAPVTVELVSTVRPWPELAARGISVTPVDGGDARGAGRGPRRPLDQDVVEGRPRSTSRSGASTSPRSKAPTRPGRSARSPAKPCGPTRSTRACRRSPRCACTRRSSASRPRAVAGTRRARSRAWPARSRRDCPHLDLRLAEIRRAVADGADEIDIVLNRSAFLSGRYQEAFDEIVAAKEACGAAHLKTILETGELGTYDQIRARVRARDGGRFGLHQDVDRQDHARGDVADRAVHEPRRSATSGATPARSSG